MRIQNVWEKHDFFGAFFGRSLAKLRVSAKRLLIEVFSPDKHPLFDIH